MSTYFGGTPRIAAERMLTELESTILTTAWRLVSDVNATSCQRLVGSGRLVMESIAKYPSRSAKHPSRSGSKTRCEVSR